MKRIIDNYKHKLGSHCSSSLMSNILRYHGLNISEELCFGIGAGLGFIYRKAFNPPLYFVLGRGDDLEEKICYHLGGMALPYITDDNLKAWTEVKRQIDDNEPVIINVDASNLQYLRERFNLFEHVRYGGHRVAVIGYDEEERIAYLSDYLWPEPQKVSYDELEAARSSQTGQTPPDNLFYTLFFPREFIPLDEAIRSGIRLNCHNMLYPWFEILGLPGLMKFCQRLLSWPKFLNRDMVMKNAYMVYMMLEVVGTGGGNFRRLYARFLREAAEILKEPRLLEAYEIYANLGRLWKEMAYLLNEGSQDISKGIWNNVERNQLLLNEIFSKEQEGILLLKGIIDEKI
ncbi:MAG: BtrH N-terminal domain-containing protein [Firmicutes bacterium]|nr:BtrH N-terminal domain-containing protein [Bacillota bacterium]